MSPTQRSKRLLESEGWLVAVVEVWNPFSKTRKDLFGFIDLLAVKPFEQPLAIQTTSASNKSARVRKILEHENIEVVIGGGIRVVVHAWRKNAAGKWMLTETEIDPT